MNFKNCNGNRPKPIKRDKKNEKNSHPDSGNPNIIFMQQPGTGKNNQFRSGFKYQSF
jgi:hypothetical protein